MSKITLSSVISTFFGIGKFPIAPGTVGSFFGILFYFILVILYAQIMGYEKSAMLFFQSETNHYLLSITVLLFFIGILASANHAKNINKDDPSEIVIDEVVGQLITTILCIYSTRLLSRDIVIILLAKLDFYSFFFGIIVISFISFRLFDIIKPWPISYFDKNIKGGLGIMLDDVVAAILAWLFSSSLLIIIANGKYLITN